MMWVKTTLQNYAGTGVATDLTGKLLSPYSLPPALKDLNFPASEREHINYTYGAGISKCG